jgi:protein TonB
LSEDSIRVTVYISFIVDTTGEVKNVFAQKVVCNDCDSIVKNKCKDEAIKKFKGMPNWIPKRERGKPVEVNYVLPVKMVLPKTENENK